MYIFLHTLQTLVPKTTANREGEVLRLSILYVSKICPGQSAQYMEETHHLSIRPTGDFYCVSRVNTASTNIFNCRQSWPFNRVEGLFANTERSQIKLI